MGRFGARPTGGLRRYPRPARRADELITAVAGKGGVGKTTIAATAVRLLARSGCEVVAIDADSNPNLAVALGAPR
ncbi:MAG: nucleotide-binding protein, partial [Mycobacteriales bacterium]